MSGPIQRRAMAALGGRAGLLLFGIGLIWLLSFARHGINWIDEGFALNGAQRVADGETLYRDFFAPYGPGRYQLLGVAFRWFGSDLMVARALWLALTAATAVVIYRIGTRLMPAAAALGAAALFLLAPMQAYKVFSPAGFLVILLVVLRAREAGTPRAWLVAGLWAGIAGLFRFELWAAGAVLLLLGSMLPEREAAHAARPHARVATAIAGLAGLGAMAGSFLLLLIARGALGAVVQYERMQKEQLARFFTLPLPSPLAALRGEGGAGTRVAELFDASAGWAPALLCLAALALALPRIVRRQATERDVVLALLAVTGGLMQVAYFGRADFDHLLHVMPVAYLLLAYGIHRSWTAGGATARAGTALAAAFAVGFVLTSILRHPMEGHSIGRLRTNTVQVRLSRGTYYDTPYQATVTHQMKDISAFLQSAEGPIPTAFLKFGSFWYWALERPNPISQEPLSTFSADPRWAEEEDAIIDELRAADVRYVLLEEPPRELAILPPLGTIHPRLASFLEREFERTETRIGEWSVLRRHR